MYRRKRKPQLAPIGYLIPRFPQAHDSLHWQEIETLQQMGLRVELFSTCRPRRRRSLHGLRDEARRRTTYLWPPTWFMALSWMVRHPCGLLRSLWLLIEISRSPLALVRGIGLLFAGATLAVQASARKLKHVHIQSCGNAALVGAFCYRLSGVGYSLTLEHPLRLYGPYQRQKWRDAQFAILVAPRLLPEFREVLASAVPPLIAVGTVGFDMKLFQRWDVYQPWRGKGPVHVFSCGRLGSEHEEEDLIRAVAQLRSEGLPVRLRLAREDFGAPSGHSLQRLKSLIAELKLTGAVQLVGKLSENQIRDELQQAHVFALPSRAASDNLAVLEAMAMQVPVVAANGQGIAELIESGHSGLLVPPSHVTALAATIRHLLYNPALAQRMAQAGEARIYERLFSKATARTLISCIY